MRHRFVRFGIGVAAICWLLFAGLAAATTPSEAGVRVNVSIAQQRMRVYVNGSLRHVWRVSTGRRGYRTPYGTYSPKRMVKMHYSTKYNYSPMPYSIFFRGGYAIHGTKAVGKLGRPASHGCIRLATGNARRLYNLVRRTGAQRARISITR